MRPLLTLLLCLCVTSQNGCNGSKSATSEPSTKPVKPALAPAPDTASREAQALAFFAALKSSQRDKVTPFLLRADDCKHMQQAMKQDGADPAKCTEGVRRFHAAIGRWLPEVSKKAQALTPTGVVKFERPPEPNAPSWAYMVTIATKEAVAFKLAGYHLGGNYRFGIPMRRK